MKDKRISDAIENVLNSQIQHEYNNAKVYRAMANCLEFNGWSGAAKLWKVYSKEEIGHAEKIIEYMQDRDCQPIIPGIEMPIQKYKGIKEIVNLSNDKEITTTKQWTDIYTLALEEKDYLTMELAKEFLLEQREEEAKTIYWIDRIVMYESSNKSLGDIDKEMEKKVG